jgi:hypothetical protein
MKRKYNMKNSTTVLSVNRQYQTERAGKRPRLPGYHFLPAQIARIDPVNPQVASRLARCFDSWLSFDAGRQVRARSCSTAFGGRKACHGMCSR